MKTSKLFMALAALFIAVGGAYASASSHVLTPAWYINNAEECVVEQLDFNCSPGTQTCSAITTEGAKLLFRDGVEIEPEVFDCQTPLHQN